MPSSRLALAKMAFLLTSMLASCGGSDQPVSETPEYVILFDVEGEDQNLSGTNVILGDFDPIRHFTGKASSDGTEIAGLDFRQAEYLGTQEFPNGIKMDIYRFYFEQSGLNQYYETVYLIEDINLWIAAPNTNNGKPSLEFSEIHKFINDYHFYIDDDICLDGIYYSECPDEREVFYGFGVSGFETEVLPGGSAEYSGIWVGRMTRFGERSEYWGDSMLSVDFQSGEVSGLLFNPESQVLDGTPEIVMGDIMIDGNVVQGRIVGDAQVDVRFDGDEVPFTGDVTGRFFGPSAEEAGGVFDLDGYSNRYGSIGFSGAFVGKQ